MNKNRYRIVFNKARNLMMAVAENTNSQGKGQQSGSGQPGAPDMQSATKVIELLQLRPIAFAVLCLFGMQPVLLQAEVIADQNAGTNNRPIVDTSANGLPLVQITTPSAAGVSRNQYSQFNVDPSGVILNNNHQGYVLTQQAGYVGANPFLGNGSARIILNEVTGTGASALRGYTEVAGQRAEVIIANPNGIVCDGCGFINTSRGILTTGVPIMGSGGSLDSFRVTGSQIQIGAGGINASNTDQLDLITRSLQVNGEIWADNLNVVSGANLVDYATLGVQVIAGDANKPTVGIDVAMLGGMYANKIHLVGTEAGVGVNSIGTIAAQAGGFTLDNRGNITLNGRTTSSSALAMTTQGDISNSGTLEASTITSSSNVFTNSSVVQADVINLNAGTLNNQGVDAKITAVTAANLAVSGTINNDAILTGGALAATSQTFANTGSVLVNSFTLDTATLNNTGVDAKIVANTSATISASGDINNTGSITGVAVTTDSAGFNNSGGVSADLLEINAGNLSNLTALAKITGNTSANLNVSGFIDNAGTITATSLTSNSNVFINSGEVLGDVIAITAASLNNQTTAAKISANTSIDLSVSGTIDNAGSIEADRVTTHNTNTFKNTGAVLGGNVVINAVDLNNTGASAIIAATESIDLMVSNAVYNADGATIYSLGDLNAAAGSTIDANGYMANNMASFTNSSGTVQADGNLRISAETITNKRTTFTVGSIDTAGAFVEGTLYVHHNLGGLFFANIPVYGHSTPSYTPYYSTEYVVAATPEATLLSGGSMWLKGNISNEYSIVAAGGDISFNTHTVFSGETLAADYTGYGFTQKSHELQTIETQKSVKDDWHWRVVGRGCRYDVLNHCIFGSSYDIFGWVNDLIYYNEIYTYLVDPQSTIGRASVTAGQNLGIDAKSISNLNSSSASRTLGAINTQVNLVSSTTTSILNITLPTNGLYHYNAAPNPAYLIETNPRFTSLHEYISSDYMLSRITLDPQQVQKRLGDGFYEQKLVSDQITDLTGRRFLPGYTSAEQEFQALMDQGIAEARIQNLVPGVALTSAQIAALTYDIVWMVALEVSLPNGEKEKLLVPQVFLTRLHEKDLKKNGSLIAAQNIDIKVAGTLENSGIILGNQSTTLNATDILNQGGSIASNGDTVIAASNDIKNLSGSISGVRVAVLAGHDVVNETEMEAIQLGNVFTTRIHNTAGIIASQNLTIRAGHDVSIAGANVSSGGDASIAAGNNFTVSVKEAQEIASLAKINTISNPDGTPNLQYALEQFRRGENGVSGGFGSKVNLASQIQTGGNLTMAAGNDFSLTAAQIYAAQDLSMAARNITITAAKDVAESSFNDHRSLNTSSYDETVIGSVLQAGGNVTLAATRLQTEEAESVASQGNITLEGASISSANGNLTLTADADIKIGTVDEKHESFSERRSRSSGVFTKTERTERSQTWRTDAIGSELSGDNIRITSGNNIDIAGTGISAKKDITLAAMNDINIAAATNTYGSEQYSHEQKTGWQITSDFNITNKGPEITRKAREDGTKQSYSRSSLSSGGGNINIMAGGNLIASGTDLDAKAGDLALTAGGTVALLAGQDTLSQESSSVTITNTNLISQQRLTITDSFNSLEYQGSTVQGNKVTINSGADIVLQAVDITAGEGGIILDAGNDIKLLAAMNSSSRKHTEKLETDGVLFGAAGNLDAFSDRAKDSKTETQRQTAQVSNLKSSAAITTHSARDTLIEASVLNATGAIDLSAGNETSYNQDGSIKAPGTDGKITFAAVKDTDYYATEDKQRSRVWQSQSGSGHYTETIRLANITAGGGLSVSATGGIVVEISEVPAPPPVAVLPPESDVTEVTYDEYGNPQARPQLTPEQEATRAAEAAVKAAAAAAQKKIDDENRYNEHINKLATKPGQEWIGQLSRLAKEKPDSVHLQQVAAAAQHWDYKAEGLTPEAAAVVVIAVTYFTAGAASTAAGSMTGTAVGTTTVASAAVAAGLTTLASQTAVSFLNNKGDIGQTMSDMGKSENIRALVTAMVTAGVLQSLNQIDYVQKINKYNAQSDFTDLLQKNLVNNTASTLVNHAINGGDLSEQLNQSFKNAFFDTTAAQGANWIGDMKENDTLNAFTHKLAHAVVGCVIGEARADDCRSGALGAVVGEISAELYGGNRTNASNIDRPEFKTDTVNFARMMAGIAAAATGNDVNLAAAAGGNAAENNYLTHLQSDQKRHELESCKTVSECNSIKEKWGIVDKEQTQEAQTCLTNGKCDSIMMSDIDIKQARDELQAACAVFCTADKLASLNELNAYFLPSGEVNKDALRTGRLDLVQLSKAGIGVVGGVAGVVTGGILTVSGVTLVVAPEPTGVTKLAGAVTATAGLANLADSGYAVYSNSVNFYRATQGNLVYLPESGFGAFADAIVPGNQTVQDAAQIASLSLALVSGRVYVGTTLSYGDSALSQYVPSGINGMLDAKAVTSPGVRSGLFIPNTNPRVSIASQWLDLTQYIQLGKTTSDYAPRLAPTQTKP